MVRPGRELLTGRAEVDETYDRASAESFVRDCIAPGTRVVTDGLPVYDKLAAAGFDHHPQVLRTGGETARQELDHVHLVISLLKRGLAGTHQGAVTPSHLQAYLDEFPFASIAVSPCTAESSFTG